MKKEALRVSTTIPVAPTTLFFAWLDSEQHSAMTGGSAKLVNDVGQKFTAWNGYITGKLITLDLGRRIIMSWRTTDFPRDAADSRVEVHLEALGGGTRVTVIHTDIPEGQAEQYRAGWNDKYFAPMRAYFSKYLPDPRKPPPPRRPPPPEEPDEEEEEVAKPAKAKPAPSRTAVASRPAPTPAPKPAKAAPKPAPKPAKPAPKPAPKPAKPAPKPAKPAAKPAPKPAKKPAAKPAKPAKKAAAKPAPKKKAAKPAKKAGRR